MFKNKNKRFSCFLLIKTTLFREEKVRNVEKTKKQLNMRMKIIYNTLWMMVNENQSHL